MSNIILPPRIQRLVSPSGAHRRGVKALFYGGPGAGKSYAAATFPGPCCHLNVQEGGINPYADPDDLVLDVTTMLDYIDVIRWLCEPAQQAHFQSVTVDPGSGIWSIYLEEEESKHGIIGESKWPWAKLKREWKRVICLALLAKWNFLWTAHMKDTAFERVKGAPGEKSLMEVRSGVKLAEGEKKVPYIMDWEFLVELGRKEDGTPDGKHHYICTKVRRPKSIPPTELYIGKRWTFDDKAPKGFYEPVIAPYRAALDVGAVDHLGTDLEEEVSVLTDLDNAYQGSVLGDLIRLLATCPSAKYYMEEIRPRCLVEEPNLDATSRTVLQNAAKECRTRLGIAP